jgi:hypothetical protein
MRPYVYTLGPLDTADADGICQSQTPAGAVALTLNGALVSGGVASLGDARRVLVTTVSNESAKTLTIVGTDWNGDEISEVIAGPNATTGYTDSDFLTVTSVTASAAFTGAVTVGTNGIASSPPFPLDIYNKPEVSLQVAVTGTINWTVQQTLDNPFSVDTENIVWLDHPDAAMVAETVNRQGNYAYVPFATRVTLNSGTGSLVYTVVQAGIVG